jgi:hypothetical protein
MRRQVWRAIIRSSSVRIIQAEGAVSSDAILDTPEGIMPESRKIAAIVAADVVG